MNESRTVCPSFSSSVGGYGLAVSVLESGISEGSISMLDLSLLILALALAYGV